LCGYQWGGETVWGSPFQGVRNGQGSRNIPGAAAASLKKSRGSKKSRTQKPDG
jgi:hypothetical protein